MLVRRTVFEDVDMSLIGNCNGIRRNMGGCSAIWVARFGSLVVDHFLFRGLIGGGR